jgi:hypothetical protein
MANENLAIYLNDHLAGSVAAIELIEHLMKSAPELEEFLRELQTQIEMDQQELKRLIAQLGNEESTVRKAAAWLAEKGARVKLAVDGPADSALGKMQALEALYLGITGKRELWRALSAGLGAVEGFDWELLIARSEEQRAGVEERRMEAARAALAG